MNGEEKNPVVISADAQRRARKKRSVIIPACVSLFLAFCLWFYVMSVESPVYSKTFSLVPVTVSQGNSPLSVYSNSGSTVDIVVSGKKSRLNQLSNSDFTVIADISSYTTAGKYNVPLTFSMPDGATKVSSSIDSLSLYLDSRTSLSVPVTVKFTEYTLDEGYEIGENALEKSVDQVTVTGPGSVLATVESAQITASLGHVTASKTISSGITLVDSAGNAVTSPYITTDVNDVTVKIPIYLTREVPLTVVYKYGYFDSSNVKVTIRPTLVMVKGEVETVNAMDSLVVATIDEKTVQEGKITQLIVPPDGVTIVDGTQNAEITVALTGLSTKTYSVTDITVRNPSGLNYVPAQDSVRVTLRGPSAMLDAITADDLQVRADASGNITGQKSVTADAEIIISDKYSTSVFEVGDYTVSLTLSDE